MKKLIKNATIINENSEFVGCIAIDGERITDVIKGNPANEKEYDEIIDATGLTAIPGVIDDQVHFREPGLTHKGNIETESRAAIKGGVTTFMDMPNVNPQTVTLDALQGKFDIAQKTAYANYSFYFGATNSNIDIVRKLNPNDICGVKVFMGSSTGNMLVDNEETLRQIFAEAPCLVATHCEDEQTIQNNLKQYIAKYGDDILPEHHHLIRSQEACYKSSSKAVELATQYGTKLHILHLSSAKELSLFDEDEVENKKITAEACVHHLWFNSEGYKKHGHRIKWNPAVKTEDDRQQLVQALNNNKLDVIATDHAPHLLSEKMNIYTKSASGGPLVQHSLVVMLELSKRGEIPMFNVVNKMCHAPAKLFQIKDRGYLRKGYFADIVLVDLNKKQTVSQDNILYKCKWSPFEGETFSSIVTHTFVNGKLVYHDGEILGEPNGQRLTFNR